jgi:hypothetical protein
MEAKKHRIVLEIVQNTDDALPFASAAYPDEPLDIALQQYFLGQLEALKNKEELDFDLVKIIKFNEDALSFEKDEKSSSCLIVEIRNILKKNSICKSS